MASETMDRLKAVAKRMPATDAKAATRAQEAQTTQLQAGLAATKPSGNITQQAQQVGGLATQASGQVAAQQQQQSNAKSQQIGQAALQEQKFQGSQELQKMERQQGLALGNAARQQALAGQEADIIARKQVTTAEVEQAKRLQAMGIDQDNRLQTLTLKQREDLNRLGNDVKQKLFDSNMQFEKSERGRKFTNERQLLDYAVANTKDNIELQNTLREMQQAADKDMIMMEAATNKLRQALAQGYAGKKQKLDQATKERIKRAIEANEKAMRDKASKAKARGQMITGVFTVAGAVVGGIYGGPAGASAGASLGGAAGGVVAGAAAEEDQ